MSTESPGMGGGARGSPIARILGPAAAGRGPFALLGVRFSDVPAEVVMSALQRRLLAVDTHPEARTPQADEVRLALHAAAAQLLDPRVREVLARHWGIGPGWSGQRSPASGAATAGESTRAALERDVLLTLAVNGGWNARSLRRVTLLAHQRGLTSAMVADVLKGMARGPSRMDAAAAPARGATAAAVAMPERPSLRAVVESIAPDIESERMLRRVVLVGFAAVVALVGAIGLVVVLTSMLLPKPAGPGPVAPAPGPVAVTPEPGPAELFPAPDPRRPAKPPAPTSVPAAKDGPAVARALSAAVEGLDVDAGAALDGFRAAARTFSREWGTYPDDLSRAAQDAVIEFIYRSAARPEVMQAALAEVRGPARVIRPEAGVPGPGEVWAAAWSLGMLTRLESEKDLPSAARLEVQTELQRAAPGRSAGGEGSFADGAWIALNQMAGLMIQPAAEARPTTDGGAPEEQPPGVLSAWREWADAVKAMSATNPARGMRSLLVALETVMTTAPEPAAGNDIAEIIATLGQRLTWRDGDESRGWLVRWLSAPGVSAADLHVLTQTLSSKASAPGFDATMVLAEGAGDGQRQDLRDRLARAWTLGSLGDRAEAVTEWAKACRERLDASQPGGTLTADLSSAVAFSRLNEAAQMIWLGESDAARDIVTRVDDGLAVESASPAAADDARLGEGGDDAGWAVKYIQADRNIPDRMALLTARAERGGTLGLVEGAVIASEAVRGAPESVRRSARDLARRFSSDAALINGLLEEAPTIPITNDNAQLIRSVTGGRLPALSDARWREAVRRALVERLLEALAAQGELAVIDRLSEMLAESYSARVRESSGTPGSPGSPGASPRGPLPPAEESVRVLRLRWQAAATAAIPSGREPFSPDQIARRYAARAALADGLVQRFAADQAALCESIAYVVASEQPAQAEAVAEVVGRLGEERRRARTILEQVHAVERAMTRLWLIRLEGGAA